MLIQIAIRLAVVAVVVVVLVEFGVVGLSAAVDSPWSLTSAPVFAA